MKKVTFLLLIFLMVASISMAQEKYAVLICGEEVHKDMSVDSSLVEYTGTTGFYHWTEFWAETYNTWEMLITPIDAGGMGFDNNKVYVLYSNGDDFQPDWIANKYNAEVSYNQYFPITDYSATVENVELVLNGLAAGQGDFPQLTQDDFLFVWTFGHGFSGPAGVEEYSSYLELYPGSLYKDEVFASKTDQITCNKKVIWMLQCRSGGFIPELENLNSTIITAVPYGENSNVADDSTVFENEIINDSIYHHTEVYFHLYSAVNQKSPDGRTDYDGQPLAQADLNGDSIISINEGAIWAEDHESVEDFPQYSDLGNIGNNTSLLYPTLLFEDIGTDGLQENHRGIIGISKTIHVLSGCQLKLKANANIHLLNQAKLIVDAGASLIIEAGDTIIANNLQNQIVVNGNITIGQDVYFGSENNVEWQGLQINNTGLSLSLQNVDFENCIVSGRAASLAFDNCDFSNGGINFGHGNISISGGVFSQSYAEISYAILGSRFVNIQDCQFTNIANNNAAIIIESYPAYSISGCTISGCSGNGISISNSGSSANENHLITDNIITGNGTSSFTAAGLYIYHSYADVRDNVVFSQNPYGIQCLNNSEISITGNRLAEYDYQTQQIRDNAVNQIYATRGSFPREVKWNAIVDEDNDCLFYYQSPIMETPYDVEYNYWGENFNAAQDLCPTAFFDYMPLWDLQPGMAPIEGAALAFESAKALAGSGNTMQAKSAYAEIVSTYSDSKYAQASLKELFAIEPLAGNDYTTLKNYYLTIDENALLEGLAGQLAAFCDVSLENWQPAIESFEGFIENPSSYEDSLFAIIDLAHTYILMEQSGYKAAFTGKLSQYRYNSTKEFDQSKDYHISLLFGESEASLDSAPQDQSEPAGRIIGNQPNPFSGTTQISFALNDDADINIYLISELGQKFEIAQQSNVSKGLHRIYFSSPEYKNGMYVCVLEINGKIADTQKVMILN